MSLSNPLPATLQAVSVVTDAYEIIRRVLEKNLPIHKKNAKKPYNTFSENCVRALFLRTIKRYRYSKRPTGSLAKNVRRLKDSWY